jgi:predicted amino acid dehydrogenase
MDTTRPGCASIVKSVIGKGINIACSAVRFTASNITSMPSIIVSLARQRVLEKIDILGTALADREIAIETVLADPSSENISQLRNTNHDLHRIIILVQKSIGSDKPQTLSELTISLRDRISTSV